MRRLFTRRPSPALVISLIALFVALGGTGYAALKLPKNSVGSRQIKTGAVGSSEVKDGSLRRRDFGKGQVPAGPRGAEGPVGPAGANGTDGSDGHDGTTGPRGPSDAYVGSNSGSQNDSNSASVTVPAGDYVAAASGQALYFRNDSTYPTSEGETTCALTSAGDSAHNAGTFATVPSHGFSISTQRGGLATVSQNSVFHLPSGGTITYTCSNAAAGTQDAAAAIQYANMRVTAIQVGALH
jgi:hypothetical protein